MLCLFRIQQRYCYTRYTLTLGSTRLAALNNTMYLPITGKRNSHPARITSDVLLLTSSVFTVMFTIPVSTFAYA